jgi:hypothetical protein
MYKVDRIVPTVVGAIFVVLITVFVARMLGAATVAFADIDQSPTQCNVSVDIVCPVTGR